MAYGKNYKRTQMYVSTYITIVGEGGDKRGR